jgi:hypothetical protein
MADFKLPEDGGYFRAIPLQGDSAATIEVVLQVAQLTLLHPNGHSAMLLDRSKARAVAAALLGASQEMKEGD